MDMGSMFVACVVLLYNSRRFGIWGISYLGNGIIKIISTITFLSLKNKTYSASLQLNATYSLN